MILVGNFPFNSFLSGFICHVGIFALASESTLLLPDYSFFNSQTHFHLSSHIGTVCLRLQLTSKAEFNSVTPERAFGDFAFCALVLLFVVFSFLG